MNVATPVRVSIHPSRCDDDEDDDARTLYFGFTMSRRRTEDGATRVRLKCICELNCIFYAEAGAALQWNGQSFRLNNGYIYSITTNQLTPAKPANTKSVPDAMSAAFLKCAAQGGLPTKTSTDAASGIWSDKPMDATVGEVKSTARAQR